jgi:dihydropyrimidinase
MKSNHFFRLNFSALQNPITTSILIITFLAAVSCGEDLTSENLILIKNGTVVNYNRSFEADILIKEDKIIKVGNDIKVNKNVIVIDATGMEILPGGIDPHVHITGPFVDDFASGSKAALAGGITAIGNLSFADQGQTLPNLIKEHVRLVDNTSIVDVLITPTMPDASIENQKVIEQLATEGYTSLKIFMAFKGFNDDIPGFIDVLKLAKREGILPMIHCEDFALLKQTQDQLIAEGKGSILFYAESRPVEAEVKATKWAIEQSEDLDIPVYIVHLSSQMALELCQEAQKRGVQVYVETRPIYLYFEDDKYKGKDGQLYTGMPPLRSKNDVTAIWQGLADGSIHTLGSDHAPWTEEQKLNPGFSILEPNAGVSNLQLMLPMLYSEGVMKNRLTLERFVAVTSTNAAKLFGLFPRKGIIAEGSDADIVIWDKNEKKLIDHNFGYSKAGFSIYKDFEVTGWPKYVLRRGEILLDRGELTDKLSQGLLLKRKRWEPFDSN